jgi:hypothetical protein
MSRRRISHAAIARVESYFKGIATKAKPKFRPFCSPVDGGKCLSALINLSNERSIFN